MPETRLDGVHHFTGVTADVTANIDFWCRILGLRFVKKTLNFETTFRYHPYYGDEQGNPGSVVTFLEFKELDAPTARRRQHPADRPRVGSYDAAEYWLKRLAEQQVYSELLRLDPTRPTSLIFHDWEGHEVELMVTDCTDAPQLADADDIPEAFRIRGIEGARSYAALGHAAVRRAPWLRRRRRAARAVRRPSRRALVLQPASRPAVSAARAGGRHHMALDAGDQLPQWREYAAGTDPVHRDLRPLLLRQLLLAVAGRDHRVVHAWPRVHARPDPRGARRGPGLAVAVDRAAARQARAGSDTDRQPAQPTLGHARGCRSRLAKPAPAASNGADRTAAPNGSGKPATAAAAVDG